MTAPIEARHQRLCLAILVLNIVWILAAFVAHAAIAPRTHAEGSKFEHQKPQLSDWPPHSHDADPPKA